MMGYYSNTVTGKITTAYVTQFFCARLKEEHITITDLLEGRVFWNKRPDGKVGKRGSSSPCWNASTGEGLRDLLFPRDLVADRIQSAIPRAWIWWEEAHKNSNANQGREKPNLDFIHWFFRGRGPLLGWLYNRLHQQNGTGTPYLPTLRVWPGSKDPFGPILLSPSDLININLPEHSRDRITKVNEQDILDQARHKCVCGIPVGYPENDLSVHAFQIDHIVPRSRSSDPRALDILANYWALCTDCHSLKGTKSLQEFVSTVVEKRCKETLRSRRVK